MCGTIQQRLENPLVYPGDLSLRDNSHLILMGLLLGRSYEWLLLTPEPAGEAFNITDGSEITFGKILPISSSWYRPERSRPGQDTLYGEHEAAVALRG